MKRTKHNTRGGAPVKDPYAGEISTRSVTGPGGKYVTAEEIRSGLSGAPMPPKMPDDIRDIRNAEAAASANANMGRKHGGRTKKFMGGPMMQPGGMLAGAGPSGMPAGQGAPGGPTAAGPDPRLGIVPKNAMNFGAGAQGTPYKKGGAVKHSDVAADKALIKKMVKPSARTGKNKGGDLSYPESKVRKIAEGVSGLSGDAAEKWKKTSQPNNWTSTTGGGYDGRPPYMDEPREITGENYKKGGRAKHAKGGEVFSGKGYPFKVPGADGGRTARASGGRTFKSDIAGRSNSRVEIEKQKDDLQPYVTKHYRDGKHVPELDQFHTSLKDAREMAEHSSRNQWRGDSDVRGNEPKGRKGDKGDVAVGDYPYAKGGRTAHAAGGRAGKGKTNINIIVAAGKGQQPGMPPAGGMMPPPPAPGGRPVMMPPPPPGGAGAGAPPMPMPIPMPMPMGGAGGPPPGMPPMPRKAGGRITKTAHSYKDMEAGAGSGEGRLQKTEIAKRSMHNSGGKVGHRSYRSYKDIDAGSGGGLGRLEKTEIAAKHSGIQKAS